MATGVGGVVLAFAVGIGVHGGLDGVDSACGDRAIQHDLTASDVPAGFRRVTGDGTGHGLTLAVPQTFRTFELTQQHLYEVSTGPQRDPAEAGVLDDARKLMSHHGVLLQIDYDTGDTVNVIRTDVVTHCKLPHGMAQEVRQELGDADAKVTSTKDVKIGGRSGMEADYVISDDAGGQRSGVQVYIAGKDALYIVTVTSTLSPQDTDAIIGSTRIA